MLHGSTPLPQYSIPWNLRFIILNIYSLPRSCLLLKIELFLNSFFSGRLSQLETFTMSIELIFKCILILKTQFLRNSIKGGFWIVHLWDGDDISSGICRISLIIRIPPSAGHHFTFVYAFLLPVLFDMLVSEIYFLCFPCWCAVQPSFDGFPCLNCNCFIIATRTDPPHQAVSPTPETTSTGNLSQINSSFSNKKNLWVPRGFISYWELTSERLPSLSWPFLPESEPDSDSSSMPANATFLQRELSTVFCFGWNNLGAGETLFSFLRPPFLSVDVDLNLET